MRVSSTSDDCDSDLVCDHDGDDDSAINNTCIVRRLWYSAEVLIAFDRDSSGRLGRSVELGELGFAADDTPGHDGYCPARR